MRNTYLWSILVVCVGLVACNPRPTVPDSMLSVVSAESVAAQGPLDELAADLDAQIAAAQTRLNDAERALAEQEERMGAILDGADADRRLKELAVGRADSDAATAIDDRRATGADMLVRAQTDLDAATFERDQASAELTRLERERALVDARIELERARAVAAQVPDFDVRPFERAVERLQP